MIRRLSLIFIALMVVIGGIYFFRAAPNVNLYSNSYCAFCDNEVLNDQKFYEDDLVIALYTHKPIFPGHCLIIPKRHVIRFELLSEKEASQMTHVIKKVHFAASKVFGTSPYLLLEKNGYEVGQTVPHVHFHYIPRQNGDDSQLKFLTKMYITNVLKPIKSTLMHEMVGKMKEAMKDE